MRLRCLHQQARKAEKRLDRSRLRIPRDPAFRLARLLEVRNGPWWYRYADGSYNPVDGEVYELSDDSGDSDREPDWNFENESDGEDDSEGEDVSEVDEDGENVQVEYEDGEGDDTVSGNEGRKEDVPSSSDEDFPEEMLDVLVIAGQPAQQEPCTKMENCSV